VGVLGDEGFYEFGHFVLLVPGELIDGLKDAADATRRACAAFNLGRLPDQVVNAAIEYFRQGCQLLRLERRRAAFPGGVRLLLDGESFGHLLLGKAFLLPATEQPFAEIGSS
jgi:hypothetical protein